MLVKSSALVLLSALLQPVVGDGIYPKSSPVLQVDANNYEKLIAQSNHATIIEFYAPWCGHCQNLKPAYEKAAKKLEGLAKVAAVNCDDEANKPFCGEMGVRGFPTLKVVTPSPKPGKPRVEDYNGARTAKAIVDFVVDRIPNHVKRVTDQSATDWLAKDIDTPKAILFTEKGTTSALLRSLAIDFLGSINFGQIRNKESSSVEKFGIEKFPTLVLLPGGDQDAVVHDGEMNKKDMTAFLSQAAEPNSDPPAKGGKKDKSQSSKKQATSTETPKQKESETSTAGDSEESISSSAKPSVSSTPETPPLRTIATSNELRASCLSPKSGTCILAIIPLPLSLDDEPPQGLNDVLTNLAEIEYKHTLRQAKLFPFYMVPDIVEDIVPLKEKLELPEDSSVEIIAVNAKRGWWRRYDAGENENFGLAEIETWIDAIRLGEGQKHKLPEGIVQEKEEDEEKAPEPEFETEPEEEQPTEQAPEGETETKEPKHEEL